MGYASYISNGYGYRTDEQGRIVQAYGELHLTDTPQRDGKAQLEAGGAARQPGDDGGHYIGTRFGGSPGAENLSAQNQVVNRSDYKRLENSWARDLQNGNRVFVSIESSYPGSSTRPAVLSGTYTVVRPDGATFTDHFSFTNENMHTGDLAKDAGGLDGAPASKLPPGVTQQDLEASLKYDEGRVFQQNDPHALNVTMAEELQELSQPGGELQFKSAVSSLSVQEEMPGQAWGAAGQGSSAFAAGISDLSAQEDAPQAAGNAGAFASGVEGLTGQTSGETSSVSTGQGQEPDGLGDEGQAGSQGQDQGSGGPSSGGEGGGADRDDGQGQTP